MAPNLGISNLQTILSQLNNLDFNIDISKFGDEALKKISSLFSNKLDKNLHEEGIILLKKLCEKGYNVEKIFDFIDASKNLLLIETAIEAGIDFNANTGRGNFFLTCKDHNIAINAASSFVSFCLNHGLPLTKETDQAIKNLVLKAQADGYPSDKTDKLNSQMEIMRENLMILDSTLYNQGIFEGMNKGLYSNHFFSPIIFNINSLKDLGAYEPRLLVQLISEADKINVETGYKVFDKIKSIYNNDKQNSTKLIQALIKKDYPTSILFEFIYNNGYTSLIDNAVKKDIDVKKNVKGFDSFKKSTGANIVSKFIDYCTEKKLPITEKTFSSIKLLIEKSSAIDKNDKIFEKLKSQMQVMQEKNMVLGKYAYNAVKNKKDSHIQR